MVRPPSCSRPRRFGFTLIELLTVIVILSILIALLVPTIAAAIRKAKEAAVQADINQLANALAQFKSQFGDYPPSRMLLSESGGYPTSSATAITAGDITYGQLATRSISFLRRFWPRATFSTSGPVFAYGSLPCHDFNGNGVNDSTSAANSNYILDGHECLVFFLGGLPNTSTVPIGMTGFAKDPTNPFRPVNPPAGLPAFATQNRSAPLFEFRADRLVLDPFGTSKVPGYLDSMGNQLVPGSLSPAVPSTTINFYAYFSSYGNNGYDPNDVNFATEADITNKQNITLAFPNEVSPGPNPYTSTLTVGTGVSYLNPQSFQIISAGIDGQYGVGGQYSTSSNAAVPLQPNLVNMNTTDGSIRFREKDNLTNFKTGRLD